MKLLQEKIRNEGEFKEGGILKVDGFLNHHMDIEFLMAAGEELSRRFKDEKIDKILTVEASGIGIAAIASIYFGKVPVVFAKKKRSSNMGDNVYKADSFSYTKNINTTIMVDKKYISEGENILIIDDFLARGNASMALADIIKQAGAHVVGAGIIVEKSFQEGRERLEKEGIRVESLARVSSIEDGTIHFVGEKV